MSRRYLIAFCFLFFLSGQFSAHARDASVKGQTGIASYYSDYFEGRQMSSGEEFSQEKMVAAHPTYPAGTIVQVTNLQNKRSITVRIADRGPHVRIQRRGVILDLSRLAAEQLGFIRQGITRVRIEVLRWGNDKTEMLLAEND